MDRPCLIAHRGDSAHAPENTLRAFEQAIARGADRIELDVQLSDDGEVFVFHDFELDRLTGTLGLATERTLAELERLNVGADDFEPGPDTCIVPLAVVLAEIGPRIPLYIEMKTDQRGLRNPNNLRLLRACLNHLERSERHLLASFDLDLVRGALEAEFPVALIAADPRRLDDLTPKEQARLSAFSALHHYIDLRLAARLMELGVPLWAWTVDRDEHRARMIDLGVQGWCANDVAAGREWIDARSWV